MKAFVLFLVAIPQFVEMRARSGIDYVNRTGEREKKFIVSSLGTGAALLDYDQDGDLDVYLVQGAEIEGTTVLEGSGSRLYRNEGGWRFQEVTDSAGVGTRGFGQGATAADVDNDGFPDLYVTQVGTNVLYRNRGDGTFEDQTVSSGASGTGWGTSAAFFDADGDADVDLYVAAYADPELTRLPLPGSGPSCRWLSIPVFCGPTGLSGASDWFFRNQGDGTYVEASREAGLLDRDASYGLGVVSFDFDDDGDADLYVANDSMPNLLFLNDGQGTFTETALFSGVAYNIDGLAQAGMGVDAGDLDGDGRLDLFVTNFSHDTNTAYRSLGAGLFADATTEMNLRMPSWFYLGWATRFVDLDNDGDEDLFVANGHVYPEAEKADPHTTYAQRNQIYWNRGSGSFEEGTFAEGDAMSVAYSSRGGAFGDIDDDGDPDAVIVNIDDVPSLLRNDAAWGNWIGLRLVGTRSNRDALGARVVITAAGGRRTKEVHTSGSFLSSSDPRLLFGLGEATRADEILVRWPSGREEEFSNLAAGSYHLIVEAPSRSPWIE
jgi:hypothetical protein